LFLYADYRQFVAIDLG